MIIIKAFKKKILNIIFYNNAYEILIWMFNLEKIVKLKYYSQNNKIDLNNAIFNWKLNLINQVY